MNKLLIPFIFIFSACTYSGNNVLKTENAQLMRQVDKLKSEADSVRSFALNQRMVTQQELLMIHDYKILVDSIRMIAIKNEKEVSRQAEIAKEQNKIVREMEAEARRQKMLLDSTVMVVHQYQILSLQNAEEARRQHDIAELQADIAEKERMKAEQLKQEFDQLKKN